MQTVSRTAGPLAIAAALLLPLPVGRADPPSAPLDRFRQLEFSPAEENFFKGGWQDRVTAEFDVINNAALGDLRTALKDENPLVRSLAARALGIRGDKDSADALAELARSDSQYMVRIRAVEALALLKLKPETIEAARTDKHLAVQWSANIAARQSASQSDDAAVLRQSFAAGIDREAMGSAKVGMPAPDFSVLTLAGKPFKLSVLGKKPIAIYFAAYDG